MLLAIWRICFFECVRALRSFRRSWRTGITSTCRSDILRLRLNGVSYTGTRTYDASNYGPVPVWRKCGNRILSSSARHLETCARHRRRDEMPANVGQGLAKLILNSLDARNPNGWQLGIVQSD